MPPQSRDGQGGAPFLDPDVVDGLAARLGPEAIAELIAFRDGFRGDYDALGSSTVAITRLYGDAGFEGAGEQR